MSHILSHRWSKPPHHNFHIISFHLKRSPPSYIVLDVLIAEAPSLTFSFPFSISITQNTCYGHLHTTSHPTNIRQQQCPLAYSKKYPKKEIKIEQRRLGSIASFDCRLYSISDDACSYRLTFIFSLKIPHHPIISRRHPLSMPKKDLINRDFVLKETAFGETISWLPRRDCGGESTVDINVSFHHKPSQRTKKRKRIPRPVP